MARSKPLKTRRLNSFLAKHKRRRPIVTNTRNLKYQDRARKNEYYQYLLRAQKLLGQIIAGGLKRNAYFEKYSIVAKHITDVLPEIDEKSKISEDPFVNVHSLFVIVNNLVKEFPRLLREGNGAKIRSAEFKMVQVKNELEDAAEKAGDEFTFNNNSNNNSSNSNNSSNNSNNSNNNSSNNSDEDELAKLMAALGM